MTAERHLATAGMIVCMILPTGLLVLDALVFHLRGEAAMGFLMIWLVVTAVTVLVQLVAAVKALFHDRFVLFLTLLVTAAVSVVVPWVIINSQATVKNLWSPVF